MLRHLTQRPIRREPLGEPPARNRSGMRADHNLGKPITTRNQATNIDQSIPRMTARDVYPCGTCKSWRRIMAAPGPTLKRRSGANSGSTPPDSSLIFFVDGSLGQKVIAEKLRGTGVNVEIHDDHFSQNARDQDWLSDVGKRGWMSLRKMTAFVTDQPNWLHIG